MKKTRGIPGSSDAVDFGGPAMGLHTQTRVPCWTSRGRAELQRQLRCAARNAAMPVFFGNTSLPTPNPLGYTLPTSVV
jgi:hypothetical protein